MTIDEQIDVIKGSVKKLTIMSYIQFALTLLLLLTHLAFIIVILAAFSLVYYARKTISDIENFEYFIDSDSLYVAEDSLEQANNSVGFINGMCMLFIFATIAFIAFLTKSNPVYLFLILSVIIYIISIAYCRDLETKIDNLNYSLVNYRNIKEYQEEREKMVKNILETRYMPKKVIEQKNKQEKTVEINQHTQLSNTNEKLNVQSETTQLNNDNTFENMNQEEFQTKSVSEENKTVILNPMMIKTILRWIMLLPLSIIAYFLSYRIFIWCNMEFVGLYMLNNIFECIGCGFSSSCYVVAGSIVAPNHKTIVAFVLSGIGVLLSIFGMAFLFISSEPFDGWLFFSYLFSIVGCVIGACYIISEYQIDNTISIDNKDLIIGGLAGIVILLVAIICLSKCSGKENTIHSLQYNDVIKENNKSFVVYICTSESAKKYHWDQDCRWLENCKGQIIPVTIDEAEHMNKTPCKACCK